MVGVLQGSEERLQLRGGSGGDEASKRSESVVSRATTRDAAASAARAAAHCGKQETENETQWVQSEERALLRPSITVCTSSSGRCECTGPSCITCSATRITSRPQRGIQHQHGAGQRIWVQEQRGAVVAQVGVLSMA